MPEFHEAGLLALVSALAASLYLLRWKKNAPNIIIESDCTNAQRSEPKHESKLPKVEAYQLALPQLNLPLLPSYGQ